VEVDMPIFLNCASTHACLFGPVAFLHAEVSTLWHETGPIARLSGVARPVMVATVAPVVVSRTVTVPVGDELGELRELDTYARVPSALRATSKGNGPAAYVATGARVPASITVTVLPPRLVTHADSPSGANLTRSGLAPTGIFAMMVFVVVEITLMELEESPATHSC
jgi:hypothetical protein